MKRGEPKHVCVFLLRNKKDSCIAYPKVGQSPIAPSFTSRSQSITYKQCFLIGKYLSVRVGTGARYIGT